MAVADPLTAHHLTASLCALGLAPDTRLAVAVSGGVDSITLAHLAVQAWGVDRLVFFTVDHRLRESSTREAEHVAQTIMGWGADCRVLTWQGAQGGTGVQARARQARYDMLRESARAQGCAAVLLAHHADDQAETFWMRLADGSGLGGLAGMRALRRDDAGMLWARPLLDVSRAQIAAYAHRYALPVIEDPSNRNDVFLRARLRGFAEALADEGLDAARLGRTLGKLRAADDALAALTHRFVSAHMRVHAGGALVWDGAAFADLPDDLARRVVEYAVMTLVPRTYPPAYDAVAVRAAELKNADAPTTSLGGCLLVRRAGDIWCLREPAALPPATPVGDVDVLVWDSRFTLHGLAALAGQGVTLGGVGERGIALLGALPERVLWPEELAQAPAAVRRGLPALWQNEKLLAVPHLSWHDAGFPAALADIHAHISLGGVV